MYCERDILKTARWIDFTFSIGLNTTKTSDAIDLGHSTKTRWPPQQFEDKHCTLSRILFVNAVA